MNQPKPTSNPSATERDRTQNTPSPDMQAEDAGTAASGNAPQRTGAQRAMKQTSQTEAERGGRAPTGSNSGN
ncbi:hypothetical protein [Ramlibacter albus]|uniref:Uncharacterized protein n=1 Tax=Ramlibacter albus TaxID=2079448 RepID=A0A923MC71_9BURK|nr:hypothetical protein [Ramlibacter albus]MBC5766841.1 hypothetical protein [Ramlibacter albus]